MTSASEVQPVAYWRLLRSQAASLLRRLPARLKDRRFWLTQVMILTVASVHTAVEGLTRAAALEAFHHMPVVFYVVPIVYASLQFGWEGGVLTGSWSALLTVPNLLLFHRSEFTWAGELVETLMIVAVGAVLGWRVERERRLRQHLQHYASQLIRAQEEERLRVARDIHDDTVQSVVLICRTLDGFINGRQGGEDRDLSVEMLQGLRQQAQTAADSLRRFSADLRPAILDDLGLPSAIQWLVRDLEARTGIEATFQVTGEPRRLDREKELALFRIAQEALRNVEKHARATRVWGRLEFTHEGIRMCIEDNGIGFNPPTEARISLGQNLGLTGMRERARLVGGHLTVQSRPGDGTRICASVPGSAAGKSGLS